MSTIQDLFQQAQLAEAAYADFLDPNKTPLQSLKDKGFSTPQATAFLSQWSVIDQYTAPPGLFGLTDGTGFSATLFKDRDKWGQRRFSKNF